MPWAFRSAAISASRLPSLREQLVDPADDADLFLGAGHQDDAVGLQALLLAAGQDALRARRPGR